MPAPAQASRLPPLFEVSVQGFDPSVVSARSRGAALYASFLNFREPYPDCTFRRFLDVTKVRRVSRAPGDPYAYVRRNYDRDLWHGTRVSIQAKGPELDGRTCTVVHPGRDSTAYAHVVVDGTNYPIIVHPLNTVIL